MRGGTNRRLPGYGLAQDCGCLFMLNFKSLISDSAWRHSKRFIENQPDVSERVLPLVEARRVATPAFGRELAPPDSVLSGAFPAIFLLPACSFFPSLHGSNEGSRFPIAHSYSTSFLVSALRKKRSVCSPRPGGSVSNMAPDTEVSK